MCIMPVPILCKEGGNSTRNAEKLIAKSRLAYRVVYAEGEEQPAVKSKEGKSCTLEYGERISTEDLF